MGKLALLCLLAIGAGIGTGVMLARNNFEAPERFGPFGDGSDVTPANYREAIQPPQEKLGTPRAEIVGSKDYDFGTGKRGSKGEHSFRIKNTGDAPLSLKVISSTCKCTVGDLEKSELEPGEETDVKLSWEIKTESTVFSQSATVRTTDPEHLELAFTISGNVVDDVTFDPTSWSITEIEPDSKVELLSTFYLYTKTPFQVIEAGWTRDQIAKYSEHSFTEREINAELEPQHRRADRAIDLRVALKPGLRQGPLSETFRVRYHSGEGEPPAPELCEVVDISLNGTVVGNVSMFGGTKLEINNKMYLYNLGTAVAGESITGSVFLSIRGENSENAGPKIGEIKPEGTVTASLGKATFRDNRLLVPLNFAISEEAKPIELSGRDRNDYGWIEIQFEDSRAPVKLFLNLTVKENE